MPFTVTVEQANLGEDGHVTITGLGRFQNGVPTEVSDERAQRFRVQHQTIEDGKVVLGPSILDAFIPGVLVEESKVTATEATSGDKQAAPEVKTPQGTTDVVVNTEPTENPPVTEQGENTTPQEEGK
jgi:hypothetical protein